MKKVSNSKKFVFIGDKPKEPKEKIKKNTLEKYKPKKENKINYF